MTDSQYQELMKQSAEIKAAQEEMKVQQDKIHTNQNRLDKQQKLIMELLGVDPANKKDSAIRRAELLKSQSNRKR